MRISLSTLGRVMIAGALAMSVLGCTSAQVAHPLTANLSGNDPDQQLEFWHTLAERPVTSNDEAFHGLLLFLDGKDSAADYAGRVQLLKSRKMLPADFAAPANEAVSRGTVAVAVVETLHLRGGWAMHVFGNTPRNAIRELEFEDVFPPSSTNQTFNGAEFLGIIGKIEDYQNAGNKPAGAT